MKYHNKKTEVDGIVFDSKAEARRYEELRMMEKMGLIHDLKRQVPYTLIKGDRWMSENNRKHRDTIYKADFTYFENGHLVVEDVKGVRTEGYRIKRELMKDRYGIEIREVRA